MPLDPSAVGAVSTARPVSWTPKDCNLYALGVGAGTADLAFTTDNTRDVPPRMLPTMPVTLGVDFGVLKQAGTIDWVRMVHAEQGVELLGPVPVTGEGTATTRIVEMWDKEKAAVVTTETEVVDADGTALFRTRSSVFLKGAGGWGGDRGPSGADETPDRAPDHTVTYATREDQALLYRLNGDRNPLHSDPAFAARAGFDRPILHGLCTYGFTGRAVLATAAGGDPDRLTSLHARFASPVRPGDVLHVDVWEEPGGARFRTRLDDGTVVLAQGRAVIDRLSS